MFFYAQIDASNEVVAISQLAGEVTNPSMIPVNSYDESLLGKIWDGVNFNTPPAPPPPPPTTNVTKLQFVHLFTDMELFNILTAAKTDVGVELLVTKVHLSDEIDLASPLTISAVNSLETNGIIGVGRAAQVLANIPQV